MAGRPPLLAHPRRLGRRPCALGAAHPGPRPRSWGASCPGGFAGNGITAMPKRRRFPTRGSGRTPLHGKGSMQGGTPVDSKRPCPSQGSSQKMGRAVASRPSPGIRPMTVSLRASRASSHRSSSCASRCCRDSAQRWRGSGTASSPGRPRGSVPPYPPLREPCRALRWRSSS